MLIFSRILPINNNMEVYNLTSLFEGYERLNLIPPFDIFDNSTNEFDINYMNWIFSNKEVFNEFNNIIYKLHLGIDICILIADNGVFDIVYESLQKLISERYGYVSNIVNFPEDWDYCTNIGPRNKGHVYNLDYDLFQK